MKNIIAFLIIVSITLSGCNTYIESKNNKSHENNVEDITEKQLTEPSNGLMQIEEEYFDNSHIGLFDGQTHKEITIAGSTYNAVFIKHTFLPFGLYVPEFITEKKFHDGNEFEGPNYLISLFERDQIDLDNLIIREEYNMYPYYIGSQVHAGPEQVKIVFVDFFSYSYEENEIIVRLTYFEDIKDSIIPQFIDIIDNLKFVKE